jgi:hypothetical protein
MIKFLAEIFRGFHYMVGISAPPPDTSDRTFVFAWFGAIKENPSNGPAIAHNESPGTVSTDGGLSAFDTNQEGMGTS